MKKFPSIEQFRHAVRAERDAAAFHLHVPAKRTYRGTVKLHGTNAGVSWAAGEQLVFQSRNRILKPGDDNAGFAAHFTVPVNAVSLKLAMAEIALHNDVDIQEEITVFGEWCGEGIQAKVAVSKLPKMFVIFAAMVNDRWLDVPPFEDQEGSVYSIRNFPTFEMEIDFSQPELAQNRLVEITEQVERECPVGKAFGISGIGEGVVWSPIEDNDSRYWFKVKGEKHSSSKVAKLAAVDTEKFRLRDELVQVLVTPNRLAQGLDLHQNEFGHSLEMRDIGHFLRWVFNDVIKEELDTIHASGFDEKELGKPISDIAKRAYLIAQSKELAGA